MMLDLIHRVARTPIQFLRQNLSDRHFFMVAAILVGLSSGLAAIVLKYFVHNIERLVTFYTSSFEDFLVFACLPLIGIVLTVFFTRYLLKTEIKKGSAEVSYSIIKKSSILPARDMYTHLVSSGITVGFGGSVGLESPMVSTGSAIGSNFGQAYGLSYKDRTVLLACGAAAGIAAAFNAPIAGVLFAIEVILADVSTAAFIPLIVAAASGALISKVVLKEGIVLTFSLQQPFNYTNTGFYILLGIAAGFISVYYSAASEGTSKLFDRWKNPWIKAVMGGSVLILLTGLFPPLFGEGYETIKLLSTSNAFALAKTSFLGNVINGEIPLLAFLSVLVLIKAIAAAITLASGGNGGNFAPSLFVGAYLGYVFARCVNLLGGNVPESNFAIVAMAGILSGVFYAPLTAIFLIAELTGGYELIIPLMIVSSLSLIVARLFQPLSSEARKLAKKLHASVETRDELILSRLEVNGLIEKNFSIIHPDDPMDLIVKKIAESSRNIFPVVDTNQKLLGIVHFDQIRKTIFDYRQHDRLTVAQLMTKPAHVVDVNETLHSVLSKFEVSQQWNLPVLDNGKYAGFLSKSSILAKYRTELLETK